MSLWKSLIDAGAPEGNSVISAEKVRVQNTFALASIVLGTPLIFVFNCLDLWEVSLVFLGTTLILCLSLYLNKIGKQTASKFVIIGIYSAILPVYSFLIGFHSGFFLYYAIAPALMLSIFDINVKRKVFIGLIVAGASLIVTLLLGYFHPEPFTQMEEYWLFRVFWMNFIFNLAIVAVLTLQIVLYHYNSVILVREINDQLIENHKTIELSLKEKEVLLAEIHHRVKNNLAVMSGLMRLQSEQSTSEEAKNILDSNADRIRSMSLIHNNLYSKDNLDHINFKQYITELVIEIEKSYLSPGKEITITKTIMPLSLSVNKAIPCGLIVNEILINAIKHAFTEKQKGKVDIQLSIEDNKIFLQISDDGIGYKISDKGDSLGITLIHSLTDQLDGNIEITSKANKGTTLLLTFHT